MATASNEQAPARPRRCPRWAALSVLAALALGAGSILAAPGTAFAGTMPIPPAATEIFARVAPSVPVIETPDGHGSGFMYDATHVMTAAHVVGDHDTVKLRFPDGMTYGNAKVVARDRMVDMALIELPSARAVQTVIAAAPTAIGTELYVLGYPGRTNTSPQPIFSRGLLSQASTWDDAGMRYLRTDAAGEPGVSGGPVIDEAGNVVGVIQFGSARGGYMVAAVAEDMRARAERHLHGEDVDGISKRVLGGVASSTFDAQLTGAPHPDESYFFVPAATGTAEFTFEASQISGSVLVSVLNSTDELVAGTLLLPSKRTARLTGRVIAGERYWISVVSETRAQIGIRSSIPATRFEDRDHGRASLGLNIGVLDHGRDLDCRPIALRVGQRLTARVGAVTVDPMLYIVSPGGAMIASGDDSGLTFVTSDVTASVTATSTGDFTVCVGAATSTGHPGGYILNLKATPPTRPAVTAGTFAVAEARLAIPRTGHATIALRDGRVMAIGGTDANGTLTATAEVYDPASGLVTTVPARDVVARRDPTTALLTDGRVLVVGGITANGVTDAVSIYNPVDGKWVASTSLGTPRIGAEAIVLDDGRVLIVTGSSALLPLATAEIFDPATGSVAQTGSMSTPRSGLYASKLADGRVLIAGGFDATLDAIGTAEVYDPKTGRFTMTGKLVTARFNHHSTLLDDGRVLLTGGSTGTEDLSSSELYDPKTGTFTATGSMQFARQGGTALRLADGRVLIASGAYRAGDERQFVVEIGAAELYDPATGRFVPAGALPVSSDTAGVAEPNGGGVFIGGATALGPIAAIATYTPGARAVVGPGTFASAPAFSRDGIALAIFRGGSLEQLEAAAKASGASGVWTQDEDGTMRVLVIGGPAFLSDAFREAFARGLPAATAVTLTK